MFSRYLSRPAWSSRGLLTRLCLGSLFSWYPSRPIWSCRGLLTRLGVGSLFLRYPSRLAWSRRGLLTRLCVGSLFLWVLVVAAPVTGREVGLWREIIFNVFQVRSGLQPICAPPRHTTPMGLPSFPTAKQKSKTENRKITNRHTKHIGESSIRKQKRKRNPLLYPSPYRSGAVVISLSNLEDPEIRFG